MNLPDDDLPPKLIIDIDDTCVDTLTAFVKWLGSHDRLKNVDGNKITNRDHLGDWLGITEELADLWVKEFSEQSWQWGALYPCNGADQHLRHLHAQGWHIVGYSRASTDMHRAILRRANLELLFPNVFDELYVVSRARNLYPMFKEHDNAICITSVESVARTSASAGHATYLITQPWNQTVSDFSIRRFNNWGEIAAVLEKQLD